MTSNELIQAITALTGLPFDGGDAFELGPGTTYVLDFPSRRVHYIRPDADAFPKSFYNMAEAVSQWDELVAEPDRAGYAQSWQSEPLSAPAAYRVLVSRRGATLQVKDYRLLLSNAAGEPVGVVGRLIDDSFRHMAMDALMRRSWKEVASAMTRRLLHDFNNTIAGIYSLSELYAELGSDPQSMTEAMEHIRRSSVRAQEITKRIRQLVTLEEGEVSYYSLGKLLRDQEEYLQTLFPKGARIRYEIEGDEAIARLDANQFRQTILQLASNSADAAGDDAEITLRLHPAEALDGQPAARIDLIDNGVGFDAEGLEKALDPFFTTKDAGKHPGLGLNVAAAFVAKLGGRLTIGNEGAGARISLLLPLTQFDAKPTNFEPAPPAAEHGKPAAGTLVPPAAEPPAKSAPIFLVYTWEDIARHPLMLAMRDTGWQLRTHFEPGQLLLDLLQNAAGLAGVIVFKSALDEKAEPLLYELGHAKDAPQVALIALGESVDAIPDAIKRNCGLVASGALKPNALLSKLAKLYT